MNASDDAHAKRDGAGRPVTNRVHARVYAIFVALTA